MEPIAAYHQLVDAVVHFTDAPRSLLHLHFGMAIYLGCQVLLGARRATLAAVIVTLLLALAHEMMNRMFHGSWRWEDTWRDLAVSLFWPAMCYAVGSLHHRHRLRQARPRAPAPVHRGARPASRIALAQS